MTVLGNCSTEMDKYTVSAHKCLKVEISELKLTFINNLLSMIYIEESKSHVHKYIEKK